MKIRDISVRKRILFANFMMVFLPVCLLALIGAGLFAGLRMTGTARQSELAMLWPEKGPALSIQFAVSSLRVKAEKNGTPKWRDLQEECRVLEEQGISTLIERNGQILYETAGTDPQDLQAQVRQRSGDSPSVMRWDDGGFTFRYTSPTNGTIIWASGNVPFLARGGIDKDEAKEFLELLLFLILGIAIIAIIFLGVYLSRLLSQQILEPLDKLRAAAAEIRQGNLDYHLTATTHDELGETCRDFDLMRDQLKIARETQEKYEQNRKELIAGISHDLSTPLTSLKGYASGILDGIARTPEKQHHYIEQIYRSACSMEKLVESLFLFSKLDLGRIPFHCEAVCLYEYFHDFAMERKTLYAERGLDLAFTGEPNEVKSLIDRLQFQRVVENILENSLKYKKGERVSVRISLSLLEGSTRLAFADNGIGVADPDLTKIFDSFYRTDPARTNVAKGSGLGLAIVKQIIVGLQGRIWAEKTPSGGLTICIDLPNAKETK